MSFFLSGPETRCPLAQPRVCVFWKGPSDARLWLGTYDPIPKPAVDGEGKPFKDIRLDSVRAKYWLGVGAQPSDPAWRLLSMVCMTLALRLFVVGTESCLGGRREG